ncbi:type III secretion protein [Halomonas sp. MCCC 1A11036]|uniref:Type III secretion protein n=1 Tax=Billgrantia zhangzhouensis TaxID=2733481 RepID=A0ABS9AF52_9GAMM|nr:hypothetical protein [Halomonas zhangzhouensis]MCE8020381.1 type III secretion protein [Halomonas zhangzhouensis]
MTSRRHGKRVFVVAHHASICGLMAILCSTTLAQEGEAEWPADAWKEREYRYVIIDQDVRDVLREMGHNLSLPVEISREVRGRIRGDVRAETAEEFLEKISTANGLAWYFDGGVLHVATRGEMSQRRFELEGLEQQRLLNEIERTRIGSPLRMRLVNGGSTLQVWGPPAWIENVAGQVERMREPARHGPARVRVFRGGTTETTVNE